MRRILHKCNTIQTRSECYGVIIPHDFQVLRARNTKRSSRVKQKIGNHHDRRGSEVFGHLSLVGTLRSRKLCWNDPPRPETKQHRCG